MNIVVAGVEGVNKGAELMLYAILQELERRFPDAVVYLPITQFPNGLSCIRTKLKLRQSPNKFVRFMGKFHITGVLYRLGIKSKYLYNLYPVKNTSYYLDASGLFFSDQMISTSRIPEDLKILLQGYRRQGTKIIYLPQAFGPLNNKFSKDAANVALDYSNLVIARDNVSLRYLSKMDAFSDKVLKYYDFTGNLLPDCPKQYAYLKGKVCIIPNKQIIDKGAITEEDYLGLLLTIVDTVYANGFEVFFLDHAKDIDLIEKCLKCCSYNIPIISDLDALDVKAIIGQAYLCISSRFHGVVSSFSSGVPCLTTSWNHKYQELLALYEMEDTLLSTSRKDCISKVNYFLSSEINNKVRLQLKEKQHIVNCNIEEMWSKVWSI